MTRTEFTLIVVAVAAVILLAMWLGWRASTRRGKAVELQASAPQGSVIAQFDRVMYVSTTPENEPLTRVAVPGLRYRGPAELSIHQDGVTICVRGEQPVHLSSSQLRGSGSAARRIGKAVETDGLALLRWQVPDRKLESSFRFASGSAQAEFKAAIDQISPTTTAPEEAAV